MTSRDFEARIRAALRTNVPTKGAAAPRLKPTTVRRAKTRRLFSVLSLGIAVIAVGTGSFVVTGQLLTSDSSGQKTAAADDPSSQENMIASGEYQGDAWSLGAHRNTSGALCVGWDPGPGSGPGLDCEIGDARSLPANQQLVYTADATDPDHVSFFGEVTESATSITITTEDGKTTDARIIPSPSELGVNFNFFVAHVSSHFDASLTAKNDAGNVVAENSWNALPYITVNKSGDGSGTVTGYRTSDLECFEEGSCTEKRPSWITCGSDCWSDLEVGVEITLEASPDEGSMFAGWSGACSGLGKCNIVMSYKPHAVTASFEKLP